MILRTKYRKIKVAVYKVTEHVKGEALAVYSKEFAQLISVSSGRKLREWSFNIMLCRQAFEAIPSMLDIGERMLSVIVTGILEMR